MSIRDIVRRERWEMNRGAHEAEIMLSGFETASHVRESAFAWERILIDYINSTTSGKLVEQIIGQLVG